VLVDATIEVLTLVRRAKTEAKSSQRASVETLVVSAPPELHAALEAGRADLVDAGSIEDLSIIDGDTLATAVTLAPAAS
jgi:valyl-tRNA synthetase